MRLVACRICHAQYDVTAMTAPSFACACGAPMTTLIPAAVDAEVHRCASCGAALPDAKVDRCAYCTSLVVRDRHRLSLVCPECWARTPDDAAFCTHCGIRFEPQAIPSGADGHPCAACTTPMVHRTVTGVGVEECGVCHGFWVPGAAFDGLVRRAGEERAARPTDGLLATSAPLPISGPAAGYRHCPECGGLMPRKNFGTTSGVLVDWCGRHGTWLDADELGRIADFVRAGGLAPTAPPPDDGDRLMRRMAAAREAHDVAPATVERSSLIDTLITLFSGGRSWD